MIFVKQKPGLEKYEADVRDLCLAFFPMEKIHFAEKGIDFYDGDFTGTRYDVKGRIKRSLYNYLNKKTGKKLLWGTLTGIRPVTLSVKLLRENSEEETREILKNDYYVSDKKIDELIEIGKIELDILNRSEIKNYKEHYSIYIGVPFCKSTCLYCSFTSFNIEKFGKYVSAYLDTLDKELARNDKKSPMTLYIGGGTPTSLSDKDFEKLLSIVDKHIDKKNLIEYTVEAGRPDTIDKEKLLAMKNHGVTRISINPQTFNQKTLDLIGRKHTVEDIATKYYMARDLGFDNINMDIIIGLPNEHIWNVLYTLHKIKKLNPDSLTVHSLALKRAARLNLELNSWMSGYYLAGLNSNLDINLMFNSSRKCADSIGLKPYYLYRQKNMAGNLENVGFSRPYKECIYNIMMMEERHSVYGFGTGSSKLVFYEPGNKRVETIEGYKSVIDYIKNLDK